MLVDRKYDIFISYRHNNGTLINELVERLQRYYNVFWDQRLRSGYWEPQLEKAIDNSSVVIINFTRDSLLKNEESKDWFYHEIVYSMNKKSVEKIIPVCYDDFVFPQTLDLPGVTDEEKEKLEILRDRQQRILGKKTLKDIFNEIVEYLDSLGIKAKEYVAMPDFEDAFLNIREIVPLPSFKGRTEEISNAVQLLENNEAVFLSGMGGIGKTELARRITEEMTGGYRCIFCRYDTDLKTTLGKIEINGINGDSFEEKEKYLRKLLNKNVLLVIDNFDFEGGDIDGYIHEFCKYSCKKLITTRNTLEDIEFECKAAVMKIDSLKDEELRELFEAKFGEPISDVQAKKVLDFTGKLTLAVPIFASLCVRSAMTVDELCEKLADGLGSFEDMESVKYNKDGNHTGTIPKIIRLLFDLDNIDEKKKKTLCNLSLLQFMNVTRSVYKDFAFFNSKGNLNVFNELVETNWIKETAGETPSKNIYELHPIINELVKTDLIPSAVTSPEVFEAVEAKLNELIEKGVFPRQFLWSFVLGLNLFDESNYKYVAGYLKTRSLLLGPWYLPDNIRRVKRDLMRIVDDKDIFSNTEAAVIYSMIFPLDTIPKARSEENYILKCFDGAVRGLVDKEHLDLIIKVLRSRVISHSSSGKDSYYYSFLASLKEKYSYFFKEDFFDAMDKELAEKEVTFSKYGQETALEKEVKEAADFEESFDIALNNGPAALADVAKKIFCRFITENTTKGEILRYYQVVKKESIPQPCRQKVFSELLEAYMMCEKPLLSFEESRMLAKEVFLENEGAEKLTASLMCMDLRQYKEVINQILFSRPVAEKNIKELAGDFEAFCESVTRCDPWRKFDLDRTEIVFEYVEEIEKLFGKQKEYYDIVYNWYLFLSGLCFEGEVKKRANRKAKECENRIMGFSLRKTDD